MLVTLTVVVFAGGMRGLAQHRQVGGGGAGGVAALGRMALGADAPTGVLVGVAIGVTLPLLAFRLFAPGEVFPVAYRRGRSAHLDVGGARGAAIRRGLEDQLGLHVDEVKPFGLAGSPAPPRCGSRSKETPPRQLFGKLYARSHLRADRWYKLGRELLYGRLEDEALQHRVAAGPAGGLRAAAVPRRRAAEPDPVWFVELTPEREYPLVIEFFEGATELGEAEVDDQVVDEGLSIVRRLWHAGLATATSSPPTSPAPAGRRWTWPT